MMKTELFLIVFFLLTSGLLLHVYASSPGIVYPEPPRALPAGAKMRIGRGQVNDFAFSQDSHRLAVACSIIGIWIYDAHTGNEITLLTGHTDSVTSVAFSPDGTTLASGSEDQTVRLWDANTFEHRVTLIGHAGNTNALAFSPDSKTLATGANRHSPNQKTDQHPEETEASEKIDSFISVWDVDTGQRKMTLAGHTGWITDLAFSPDGSTLASASTDGSVRLWEAATGHQKMTLTGHTDQVVSIAFSADSKRLASCGDDETTRLWDAYTGEQKLAIEGINYGAVAFSPDSSTLVSSQGIRNATIRLWDVHTGAQKAVLEAQLGHIFSVVFSPNGSKIVSLRSHQNAIQWWDPNGTEFQTPPKDNSPEIYAVQEPHPRKTDGRSVQIPSLVFSPDGEMIAAQLFNTIQLWNAHTKEQKAKIEYPDFSSRRIVPLYGMKVNWRPADRSFAAFSADGKTFACGDGTTKIWLFDPNTGKYRATLKGHTDAVYNVTFSPNGEILASASEDRTVRVWNAHTGEHHITLNGHADAVYPLAFSADGSMLASGSWDATIRLWDVQTGEERRRLVGHWEAVSAVAFADNGETLISLGGREIRLWDVHTGKEQVVLESNSWETPSIAFSPDSGTFASGDRWEIQLWHADTAEHKGVLTGHLDTTALLAFSPDGKILASAGKTIQLWDVEERKNRSTFIDNRDKNGPYYNPGDIWSLAFSSDSQFLAAGVGSALELWDVTLHQHRATLQGHGPPVTSVAFAPYNGMLASTSYDGTIVLWEPIQPVDTNTIAKITTSPTTSPTIGEQLTFNIEITGAENVAGYQLTVAFDETVLRYVSSTNGGYLPDNAFLAQPIIEGNQITLASTGLTGTGSGDGVLATLTFEIVDVKPSALHLTDLILSDPAGKRSRPAIEDGQVEAK